MQRAASSKIIVMAGCLSVALLITSSLVSSSNDLERDRETEFLNGQLPGSRTACFLMHLGLRT